MATTHNLNRSWADGGANPISVTQSFSGTGESNVIDETVADSVTDKLVSVAVDVSQLTCIYILSTQDMTLETNSSSSPTDTILLTANNPYIWYTGSYDTNKLTADVTAIYLTNASGSSATFNLRSNYDATP